MSRRSGRRSFNIDNNNNSIPEDEDIMEQSQTESQQPLNSENQDLQPNPEEQDQEEVEGGEDFIDEEDEITRCICQNDELQQSSINPQLANLLKKKFKIEIDQGLFIQCDKCHVWQHGYCVGLYENNDVPDKYWCELCKPELHTLVKNDQFSKRTLYKPVNDKRKKIEMSEEENHGTTAMKPKRREKQAAVKKERKDRRHHHPYEDYDEQLQKALRESAKESGINVEEEKENSNNNNKKRKIESVEDRKIKEESSDEIEQEQEKDKEKLPPPIKKKGKKKNKSDNGNSNSNSESSSTTTVLDKEELIKQNSKPRYDNEKASIYELRKRTGAILEWLGRSQIELQDEIQSKQKLFENESISLDSYNENLKSMENLTNQIISWEEKYGKYAP
ncbi:unnamed protein product [Candida verbasci]|uniref:Zinc finger PHD-type domain-containing protein n=1 Tax=Candida verbasci TaxID=1227364 RepID=A0A9W4U386_9ASCO|nr:unnamed protein product [Candida verbasci]